MIHSLVNPPTQTRSTNGKRGTLMRIYNYGIILRDIWQIKFLSFVAKKKSATFCNMRERSACWNTMEDACLEINGSLIVQNGLGTAAILKFKFQASSLPPSLSRSLSLSLSLSLFLLRLGAGAESAHRILRFCIISAVLNIYRLGNPGDRTAKSRLRFQAGRVRADQEIRFMACLPLPPPPGRNQFLDTG